MPKVKSPYIFEMRGKMGEWDFRTRANSVIEMGRTRMPSLPPTQAQLNAREVYGKAVGAWRALSAQQKAQWNAQAQALKLSGYNAFVQNYIKNYVPQAWYAVRVYNPGGSLSDVQIRLAVSGDTTFTTDMIAEKNIEVWNVGKTELLPFWIESFSAQQGNAAIHVRVPSIAAGMSTVAYVTGNPQRTTPLSSGTSTFIMFDHFDSQGSWTVKRVGGSGFANWSDSYLKIKSTYNFTSVVRQQNIENCEIFGRVYAANASECITLGATDGNTTTGGDPYNGYSADWNGWAGQSNRQRIRRWTNGNGPEIATTGQGLLQTGQTYILALHWTGSTLKQQNDYGVIQSATDTQYSSCSHIHLAVWGSAQYPTEVWWDWIAVRKAFSQSLTVSYQKT